MYKEPENIRHTQYTFNVENLNILYLTNAYWFVIYTVQRDELCLIKIINIFR